MFCQDLLYLGCCFIYHKLVLVLRYDVIVNMLIKFIAHGGLQKYFMHYVLKFRMKYVRSIDYEHGDEKSSTQSVYLIHKILHNCDFVMCMFSIRKLNWEFKFDSCILTLDLCIISHWVCTSKIQYVKFLLNFN